MIRINLVPREILAEELKKRQLIVVGIVAGVLVAIFAGISFSHYYKGVKLDKELAKLEETYDKLKAIVQKVEEAEAKARSVRARLNVMKDLERSRPFYPRFMTELLKHMVPGVWLRSLSAGMGKTKGTLSVDMDATAVSVESVTNWLRTLDKSEVFSEPKLGGLSFKLREVSFKMSTKYTDTVMGKKGKE